MVLKVEATFDNLVLFETVGAVTKKSLLKAINVLPGTDPHKVIVIHGLANLLSICDEQTIGIRKVFNLSTKSKKHNL